MEVLIAVVVAFILFFVIPMGILARRNWKRLSILPSSPRHTDTGNTPGTDMFGNIEPPRNPPGFR